MVKVSDIKSKTNYVLGKIANIQKMRDKAIQYDEYQKEKNNNKLTKLWEFTDENKGEIHHCSSVFCVESINSHDNFQNDLKRILMQNMKCMGKIIFHEMVTSCEARRGV